MELINFPHYLGAFVGRKSEIGEIVARLNDPACRLLTLVGPGGIGKTRLAVEIAHSLADEADDERFPQGVYFVPLQPLSSPDHIVTAIAEAVGFQFFQADEPPQQLLDYFREKALLLVLDNFEHLLDGVAIISNILAHAPRVKILTTSRETLNLHEEWLYQIKGMRFPIDAENVEIERYSAIQLFAQNARRVQPDFSLASEQEAVSRICQLVEGLPLALEITAAWLKRLPCREVAHELERGLDILEAPIRNVPSRHRSMRTVFAQSWAMLAEKEQAVFKGLSVFRGGFHKEGAEAVVGASLGMLSSLVDKSLLRVDASGCYDLHELLRQYGEEQLDFEPEVGETVRNRHCEYYIESMRQWEVDLKGRRQLAALKEIEADFENIRTAWGWGLSRNNYRMLELASESLFHYCEMHGRFPEGYELFWAAQQQLDAEANQQRSLWARILVYSLWLGEMYRQNSKRYEDGSVRLDEYLVAALEQGDTVQIALCQWVLGALGRVTGNYAGAQARLEQSLALYSELADHFYMAKAADWLASAFWVIGQRDDYIELSRQSLDWRRAIGDQFGAASSLWNLALIELVSGHYSQARGYIQEMGEIYIEMGSRGWAVRKVALLAWIAFQQGDFQEAQALSDETLAIVADTGTGRVAGEQIALTVLALLAALEEDYAKSWRLCERAGFEVGYPRPDEALAVAACGLEDYSAAQHYFLDVLSWNSTVHQRIGTANLLSVAAILLAREGQEVQAVEMLGLAFHHPASAQRWLREWPLLTRLRTNLEASLGAVVYTAAWERGKTLDLDTVMDELHPEMTADQPPIASTAAAPNQSLQDPLTDRELEVLRLLAAGHSNRQIAQSLVLALGTVKWYISEIYSKLGVASRTQAVARASELDLLS